MGRRINWVRVWPWALVGLSAVLRLYQLSYAPEFCSDEGFNIETTRGLLDHGQMTRWFLQAPFMDLNKPVLFYWLMGRVFTVFGLGAWQARLLSALAGILTTYLLFLLGRTVWNSRCGAIAALLHATAHPMLWADRVAKEDGLAATLGLLGLYLTVRGAQREQVRYVALAGLALGAALCTKLSIVYLPLGLVLALLLLAVTRELSWGRAGVLGGVLAVVTGLTALPWLLYYWHFKGLPPFAAGLAPFAPLMAREFLSNPYTMLLAPSDLLHPGALVARTQRLLTQVFVWDPVRAVGLTGFLSFLCSRHVLRDRGALIVTVSLLSGLGAFWCVGGRLRYVHCALLLLYLLAGVILARLREITRHSLAHRFVPVALVLLVGFGLTHSVDRLDTPNYDRYPDTWRPTLSTDSGQLPRASRWLAENVGAGSVLYADSAVGALTGLPYVDLLYFANAAEVYRRYHPQYLVVSHRLRYDLAEGRGLDPYATFDLQPVKTIKGAYAPADVEIYYIRGLKSPRTMVRRGGVLQPL
jgi:4-amino-4-deoxy-L-arabinose transferase-like glycosyltransferase